MQRYHDVISSFGGKTSYDADNRPLLVMRSNLWASGYDVDGTDQTALGQFSGRGQQTYKHSVSRLFVPEHGTMFTLALVRLPPTATKEIQYLNAKGALTYTDIAGDPVLYGNLPPREISMKDGFRSGDSSKKFKIAEGLLSSRRRHTICSRDWSSDVCSSDLCKIFPRNSGVSFHWPLGPRRSVIKPWMPSPVKSLR